jgi:hypothetical protein
MTPATLAFSAPLSKEKKESQEKTINEAQKASNEARQVSVRLRHAAKLYKERLTGIVEDK